MRRLLLFGIGLLPLVLFSFATDAMAGQTDGVNREGGFFNPPTSAVPVNSGCRAGDPALLRDIVEHPSDYYVNVHTTLFPKGAGRGQLTK